jgi:8-oxo-dGTP diphosphatase
VSGEPVAGDDALEARFVALDEVESLIAWSETRRIIRLAAAGR